MNKWMKHSTTTLLALSLLLACQKEDTATQKQLAQLQAQLQAEKDERVQREAREREEQRQREQEAREARIRQETEDNIRAQIAAEAEAKAAAEKANQEQQARQQQRQTTNTQQAQSTQQTQNAAIRERIVRYPATVVTQSGYGSLSLRGTASTQGMEIGRVADGDEVTVIARTNLCQVIGNVEGCWVKVETRRGIKGYMFDGYLNREVLSQQEKADLQGRKHNENEYESDEIGY